MTTITGAEDFNLEKAKKALEGLLDSAIVFTRDAGAHNLFLAPNLLEEAPGYLWNFVHQFSEEEK
jgi:hypothetical protein